MIKKIRIMQFIIRTIITFSFLTLMVVLQDKLSIFKLGIYVVLPGIIMLGVNWFVFNRIVKKTD